MILFSSVMQKEKLAIIGLVVIIIVALSAFIAITYGQDILKNLFGGEEQVKAVDDTITCYKNKDNKINYILSNDKYTNITSYFTQIQIISQPSNGIIRVTNISILYSPNLSSLSDRFS